MVFSATHTDVPVDAPVTELTTFEVDPRGMHVRLNMRAADGEPRSLTLPVDSLMKLLMTLPEMVGRALRNRYGDESLRLVHELQDFKVELADTNTDGDRQFILTLATHGGFEVSFSASQESLDSLSGALAGDALSIDTAAHRARLS